MSSNPLLDSIMQRVAAGLDPVDQTAIPYKRDVSGAQLLLLLTVCPQCGSVTTKNTEAAHTVWHQAISDSMSRQYVIPESERSEDPKLKKIHDDLDSESSDTE